MTGGNSQTATFTIAEDADGTYAVDVNGLSGTFTVQKTPAAFTTSALSISPTEVKLGGQVSISVRVTNTGGREGSYTVVLKIGDVEEARKGVTLGAGRSETVTFTVAKETEGSYAVNIDGEVGRFTVTAPPAPEPVPTQGLPVKPPTNWGLIAGIIAGCVVVVGLLVYFFVWRRRGVPEPSSPQDSQ